MARVSRKAQNITNIITKSNVYKVGAYVRISNSSTQNDSDSINIQKSIITDFVATNSDMKLVNFYEDDGFTGTNFNRPSFNKMIDDIRDKKINCIIVKDISRFGRNHLEVGNYIENILPFLNTRLISISDNYDSINENDYSNAFILPFKNIMNEIYSKELSKKIGDAIQLNIKNGNCAITITPYGYKKDANNPNLLVVDEDTAWVVKEIFSMRSQGLSYNKIIVYLYDNNVPVSKDKRDNLMWSNSSLRYILENQVYLGDLVYNKSHQSMYYNKKYTKNSKEDYVVFKDMHTPIIEQDIFDKVQAISEKNKKVIVPIDEEFKIFNKLLICGKCKCEFKLARSSYNAKNGIDVSTYYYLNCKQHHQNLEFNFLKNEVTKLILEYAKNPTSQTTESKSSRNKFIDEINANLNKFHLHKRRLLEEKINNLINDDEYIKQNNIYDSEINRLNIILEDNSNEIGKNYISLKRPLDVFIENPYLNKDNIKALIKEIVVNDAKKIQVTLVDNTLITNFGGTING